MTQNDIARERLGRQQITAAAHGAPEEIVRYFGAMQAQDYPMAKWALGLRLPGATDETIERAVAEGRVLRTHVLRPTWHFVAPDDARWMIGLSAPQLRVAADGYARTLGLDAAFRRRARESVALALAAGPHPTRREIALELERAGLAVDNHRIAQIMFDAEIEGLAVSGAPRGKEQTYAPLDERAPAGGEMTRDEALAELARRYFTSHGPATLKDFVWWSGLPAGDARRALEMNRPHFASEVVGDETYWRPETPIPAPRDAAEKLHLLPAFDEFMVSYKDRRAALDPAAKSEAIAANGIFKPIVVVDGRVEGVWKRSVKGESVLVEKTLLAGSRGCDEREFAAKAGAFAAFIGKRLRLA